MKNIIAITSLLVAGTALANAESLVLPESSSNSLTGGWFGGTNANASGVLDALKTSDYGVYAKNNGGESSRELGECVWVNNGDGSGTIKLAGRNGTQGESLGLVLGNEITSGTTFNTLTLSVEVPENSYLDTKVMGLGLGFLHENAYVDVETATATLSSSETKIFEIVLSFDSLQTWTEGDKIVVAVAGPAFTPATNLYDVNIKGVSYSTVPEPSAFGLLAGAGALALVAARRRRRKA